MMPPYTEFSKSTVRIIYECSRAMHDLRRRTGIDTKEWRDGLQDILSRTYTCLSERLDSLESEVLNRAMFGPPPGMTVSVGVQCKDCDALKCDKHKEVRP